MNIPDWPVWREALAARPWFLYDPDYLNVRREVGVGFVHNLAPVGNFTFTDGKLKYTHEKLSHAQWQALCLDWIEVVRTAAEEQGLNIDNNGGTHDYVLLNEEKALNELVPGDLFIDPRTNKVFTIVEDDDPELATSLNVYTLDHILDQVIPNLKKGWV